MSRIDPHFKWAPPHIDPAAVRALSGHLRLRDAVAAALYQRGVRTREEADAYFHPTSERLHDPFLLPDMDKAVARTIRALKEGEKILIYGDYDVDGITGAAQLVLFLRSLKGNVNYYVPDRLSEGYGLNIAALDAAVQAGYTLLIAVDSGTTAVEQAFRLREAGVDFIALDHHEPSGELPYAEAIVNPKLPASKTPFRELCAAAIAFKFILAMGEVLKLDRDELIESYIELVALGSVADVMPLTGENRFFVAQGLSQMTHSRRPGLFALVRAAGVGDQERLTVYHVGFMLAPRLNAAGRVWNPRRAVNLLLSECPDESARLAQALDRHNKLRQERQAEIFNAAVKMLDGDPALSDRRTVTLFHPDWHVGIVGIVASKLLERSGKPAILLGESKVKSDVERTRGTGKRVALGSARSVEGFDMFAALLANAHLMLTFGGHSLAAGLRIEEDRIEALRDALDQFADEAGSPGSLKRTLKIDSELPLDQIDGGLLNQLAALEPCGAGNQKPIFVSKGLRTLEARGCGRDGRHLTVKLSQGSCVAKTIGFDLAGRFADGLEGESVDIAFHVIEDRFYGGPKPKIQLLDVRSALH